MTKMEHIRWQRETLRDCSILRPVGELNALTYRRFSDDLVKFAMDQPAALVVDVAELRITGEPLLTAFSAAWMRVGEWPGVPIMLVVVADERRAVWQSSAINRFVPVFGSVSTALAALAEPPARRLAKVDLVPASRTSGDARRFIRETCGRWAVPEVIEDASAVVTELVENALLHAHGDLRLRLELRGELLTVAVDDDEPRQAVLREFSVGRRPAIGLRLVAELARAWGSVPRWPEGKVVWATLPVGERRQPVV